MLEKHSKLVFNKKFYKKLEFWIGLILTATNLNALDIQTKRPAWWLDLISILIGIICVVIAFILKKDNYTHTK